MNEPYEKFQKQLLEVSQNKHSGTPLSEPTQKAYRLTPRHLFIKRFWNRLSKEWIDIAEDNINDHLASLYEDKALPLFGDDTQKPASTISQPSFVLRMLDMLQIKPGHKIFEIGAGSGWNAALMGRLVSSEGHVFSLEIIPEVAQTAASNIERMNIKNVSIIQADGGEGYVLKAPYDRAVFTAGSYDLPHQFYNQIKDNGLMLIVVKNQGGGDNLYLMRKNNEYFESVESTPCFFVQMTGEYQMNDLNPIILENEPEWIELKNKEINKKPFWWGGKGEGEGPMSVTLRTLGIRSFLGITEPLFCVFKTEKRNESSSEENYFGLWDKEHDSLVIAKNDCLISYGNAIAEERLMENINRWVTLGMPTAACFDLKIYPIDYPLTTKKNQWITRRRESQFLWSLPV